MLFTRSDKGTPFSELERFQPLSGYERVSSESGARAKTGAGNEPRVTARCRANPRKHTASAVRARPARYEIKRSGRLLLLPAVITGSEGALDSIPGTGVSNVLPGTVSFYHSLLLLGIFVAVLFDTDTTKLHKFIPISHPIEPIVRYHLPPPPPPPPTYDCGATPLFEFLVFIVL